MQTLAEKLQIGVALHKDGKLPQAEQIYREVLQSDPYQADAYHLLGIVATQSGRLKEASTHLERAIALRPDVANYYVNLGETFRAQGRFQDALKCYKHALQLQPTLASAHGSLGNVYLQLGMVAEAKASYQEALRLQPGMASVHSNLANILLQEGKLEEAEASCREALMLQPSLAEAHSNLSSVLLQQGRLEESASSSQAALGLQPNLAAAHNNLGNALMRQGKSAEAASSYREALRLQPNYAAAINNLGDIHSEQGQLVEAEACYRKALRIQPTLAIAHNNLGNILAKQDRWIEALACYREALRLQPTLAIAYSNMGNALAEQGQRREAIECYQKALALQSDLIDTEINLAVSWLLLGNFEKGWPRYEKRWLLREYSIRSFPKPRWNGEPLGGKTIFLYIEQGYGDILQFVRYAPLVKAMGGRIVVECRSGLESLLLTCPGVDQVVVRGKPIPNHDVQAPLLSLAGIFHITSKPIPAQVPYLFPDADLVEHWRQRLSGLSGMKVGIAWQGNPRHKNDLWRSMPLELFAPLAEIPGVQLLSLQKGFGAEQLLSLNHQFEVHVPADNVQTPEWTFMDTAAVVMNLDVVVSVDTSLVHLTGALGRPAWVMLPHPPEWRWMLEREDSHWYPTVRLFRQTRKRDWNGVMLRVRAAIEQLLADR